MAFDKVVDSQALDGALGAVADAIRGKTGSAAALTLEQMPGAISGIQTGSGAELPELSNPGTAGDLMEGKQLIDGAGRVVDGTFTIAPELAEQAALIDEILAVLPGKTVAAPVIQALEVTENGVFTAPEGVDGYAPITVNVPVPEGYIQPAGTLEIMENGEYDVAAYAAVSVSVPGVTPADPREEYQRVEYITAAEEGTYPYIITDFYGDNESGMEVVASFPVLQDRIPMGSRENSDATRFYCAYPMSASSIYYGFNTGASVSCALKVDTIYRLQTNFLNSRLVNAYDEDGIRKGGTSLSGTLVQQTAPVSVFGYNYASTGNVTSKREYKLYSARCSRRHEVVREYIPVRRKSDGAVGLYEKFSGTFWGNDDPNGSAFAAGPDIDWEV